MISLTNDSILFILFAGCKRVVENEGMPLYRHPFEKGHLIIKFNIEFPENNFASEDQLSVSMGPPFHTNSIMKSQS